MAQVYDIAIIGGGVNGCGIARDAAGRGLKVLLAEKADLASGTSSASTKLVHGGLRYLEHYEFKMVHEALAEREVLLAMAPHIIWPLRFVLPHHSALRPAWLIRLGLFLYDHLGGRKILPASRGIDLRQSPTGKPLQERFTHAFEYSDCWVDDARLVVLNAMDAHARGAVVRTRTEVVSARRGPKSWTIDLHDKIQDARETIEARALINAAGPWVDEVLNTRAGKNGKRRIRLVKGSHIVVRRLFEHDKAYIFQNDDRRIVFAIPYEDHFTLIGTTDVDYIGDPGAAEIDASEIDYLCRLASGYFKKPVRPQDVVWSYSGVRPLLDDGASAAQEATRDYVLELDDNGGAAPMLNVFGGKITTYRRLAEDALQILSKVMPVGAPWTAGAALPGGDFPVDGVDAQVRALMSMSPGIEPEHASRLIRTYGTRAKQIVDGVARADQLGRMFGGGLSEREVQYLIDNEWARTAEDVLWRRTKMGLRLTPQQAAGLSEWLAGRATAMA
ncbi:MAG: glycerol-3-phosphate dehydrogenase [Hyphomicrobiaceae bacterium]